MSARRGRAQANGSDHINAHAASRFLRALPCPAPSRRRRRVERRYDPAVTPLLLVAASLVAMGAGVITLRSFGPRYRIGRLLATTPPVTRRGGGRDRARRAAALRPGRRPDRRDGRVRGRRPSAARLPPDAARVADGRGWASFEDSRQAVAVRHPRGPRLDRRRRATRSTPGSSSCRANRSASPADLADRAPDDAVARRRRSGPCIEQVSSVEHAIVLGVPVRGVSRRRARARLTAGLGRPLVLTTLEPDEAMRILAGGSPGRGSSPPASSVGTVLLVAAGVGAWAGVGAVMSAVDPGRPSRVAVAGAGRRPAQQRRRSGPRRSAGARDPRGRRHRGPRDRRHDASTSA